MQIHRLLFFVTLSVGLLVTLSTESTKFDGRYLVDRLSEGDKIFHIASLGHAVHQC